MAAPARITAVRPPSAGPTPSLDALMEQFLQGVAARNGGSPPPLRDWVQLAEAWRIARALRRAGGNRSAAARKRHRPPDAVHEDGEAGHRPALLDLGLSRADVIRRGVDR
jgi:hypothetical protein